MSAFALLDCVDDTTGLSRYSVVAVECFLFQVVPFQECFVYADETNKSQNFVDDIFCCEAMSAPNWSLLSSLTRKQGRPIYHSVGLARHCV